MSLMEKKSFIRLAPAWSW